ncbi:hypothetical protein L3556_15360 [Candidatus Synechococcus calcipolaris G9]|uniref:Ycf66 family protein n=1 Tax=Candidatus Synechococcus calcipolaris G9 TaxID=1497997 RepID=A0ABT6F3D2_9SYNE|nr:Ycf66 family protein [Candidatus Synechococcus calcipolaris]MDG2992296.1 hypothetical protein [Candidatus Synechococcus calcipolaris G9]
MLTELLAWSVAIASLGLYLSAFFLPELYRKFDLVSSGAGLFFALTLWVYGDRIRGGLLLGETAAVVLLLWFGWQTLQYRWQLTHEGDRTDTQKARTLWSKLKSALPGSKSDSDGDTPKVAGKIAEFLGSIDLEKIKGQFQKRDKDKNVTPTQKDDSPSKAEPALDVTSSPSLDADAWGTEPESAPESSTVTASEPSPEPTPETTSEIATAKPEPLSDLDPVPAIDEVTSVGEAEQSPETLETTESPESLETAPANPLEDGGEMEHKAIDSPEEVFNAADILDDIPEQSDDEGEGKLEPTVTSDDFSEPSFIENILSESPQESVEEQKSSDPDWPPPGTAM